VEDAALLVMQLDLKVNVLVINLTLTGGAEFVAALHRTQPNVRVIGVRNDPSQTVTIPGLNAILAKPTVLDEAARLEWLRGVENVLANSMGGQ